MVFFCRPADAFLSSKPESGQGNLATLAVAQDCMCCLLFFVIHVIWFSMCFQLGTSPPSRDCGLCHMSLSCWFSPFVSTPRHDCSLREGFDVGFPCLRACVFNSPFFVFPPATLTVRGRVLPVVCLAIAPFSSPPPATLAVRGRFLTGGLPYYSDCVSFNYFSSRFSWLHSAAVQRCGSGF